jgi:hypothetical protein
LPTPENYFGSVPTSSARKISPRETVIRGSPLRAYGTFKPTDELGFGSHLERFDLEP